MKSEKQKEYMKLWRLKNKDSVREYGIKYYAENKDKLSANLKNNGYISQKKWVERNKEKAKKSITDYKIRHRKKLAIDGKVYREKNKEIIAIKRTEKFKRMEIKEQRRNYAFKRKYKITTTDYNTMFEGQLGCCIICKTHQSDLKKALQVDHSHITGEVRGLLCHKCNSALGFLKEDIDIIESLIQYIKKYNK